MGLSHPVPLIRMIKYTSYLTSQKRPIIKLCRNPKEPNTHPKRDLKHAPKEAYYKAKRNQIKISKVTYYQIWQNITQNRKHGVKILREPSKRPTIRLYRKRPIVRLRGMPKET